MNLNEMMQEQENVEGIEFEMPENIRIDLRGVFCPNCNAPSLFEVGHGFRMEPGDATEDDMMAKCRLCWNQFTMGYLRKRRA